MLLVANLAALFVSIIIVIFQLDDDGDSWSSGAMVIVDIGSDLSSSRHSRGSWHVKVVVGEELIEVLRFVVIEVEAFQRVVLLVDLCDAHHEDLPREVLGARSFFSRERYSRSLLEW